MFSPLSGRAIVAKNVQVTVSMGYKSCIWVTDISTTWWPSTLPNNVTQLLAFQLAQPDWAVEGVEQQGPVKVEVDLPLEPSLGDHLDASEAAWVAIESESGFGFDMVIAVLPDGLTIHPPGHSPTPPAPLLTPTTFMEICPPVLPIAIPMGPSHVTPPTTPNHNVNNTTSSPAAAPSTPHRPTSVPFCPLPPSPPLANATPHPTVAPPLPLPPTPLPPMAPTNLTAHLSAASPRPLQGPTNDVNMEQPEPRRSSRVRRAPSRLL